MSFTPPPTDFGAPAKFSDWRDGQDNLFWDILDCQQRISIHNAPVGCGKSLAYIAAALAMGLRVAVVTESKGLQDQISRDFGSVGLFDMRGLQNYTCKALAEGGHLEDMWQKRWGRPTCDVGPCTAGLRCDLKDSGCGYFDDYRLACTKQLVSTNYAYWIAIHKYGQGLGTFDMLILDEAHSADTQLSSALSVEFTSKDFKLLCSDPPRIDMPLQNWRMWARVALHRVTTKLEFFAQGAKIGQRLDDTGAIILVHDTDLPDATELKAWKKLESKCSILSESTDDWVIERVENNGNIRIAPVWVRKYAEMYLFLNIPRIVLMSATVRPKTAALLGLSTDSYEFTEYPSTFPVSRRPIYWIPTVKLNYESTQEELRTWVVRIDQIIARRLDRKGIVHTVSYDRQRFLLEHSRFKHLMLFNKAGNTQDVVQSFRNAPSPAILVSPSVGTGFDFAFDFCRYQIVGKVPFRDHRGAILKMQAKDDPEYPNYLTSQDIIQIYGRPNRDKMDFSETFFVDDQIEWFIDRYSGYKYDKVVGRFNMTVKKSNNGTDFFPDYLLAAFQRLSGVPDPPLLSDISDAAYVA